MPTNAEWLLTWTSVLSLGLLIAQNIAHTRITRLQRDVAEIQVTLVRLERDPTAAR